MTVLLTHFPLLLAHIGLLMCPSHTLISALSGSTSPMELGCPHVSPAALSFREGSSHSLNYDHDGEGGRQAGDAT